MGYLQSINSIAYNVLTKNPDIPDFHLMVGTAECLDSMPLLIQQAKIPKGVAKQLQTYETMSNEDIENAIADNMLEINDFNGNTAVLAGLIGGVR